MINHFQLKLSETLQDMSSVPEVKLRSPGGDPDAIDQECSSSIVVSDNPSRGLVNIFEKNEHLWYVSSQIPTDLSIQVEDVTFNVHKFPLVSKCGYFSGLEAHGPNLNLEGFPGGPETFETVLKFCYGLPLDLTPDNIAPIRCASEYLDMTEEFDDGNLISKTEAFITFVVLTSWKDTLTVLKSCERLSPWVENLQIIRRCSDSLAWKASRDDSTGDELQRLFDDVAVLRIDHFMKVITAIKARGAKPETIGKFIMSYAHNWLPGIDDEPEGLRGFGLGKNQIRFGIISGRTEDHKEHRTIIESLLSIVPTEPGTLPCRFMLKMLRTAVVYSASPALVSDLEKKVGVVLEDANVSDLLIPKYRNEDHVSRVRSSPEHHTMHDTDMVQRILEYFLMHEQQEQQQQKAAEANISKLLDNYLAEIAKDPNLPLHKFQVLAEALPGNARPCDDGIYRAIDTYLKTHPTLSEHDRRRLCRVMNCEKLSLDACMHAAQNDRLPLRIIVQVMFSEQIKMRKAMQSKEADARCGNSEVEENHCTSKMEMGILRTELENVKMKMAELQADYYELQHEYEKLGGKQRKVSGWGLRWEKIKRSIHMKHEADEGGEEQQRRRSRKWSSSFRRRLSLS